MKRQASGAAEVAKVKTDRPTRAARRDRDAHQGGNLSCERAQGDFESIAAGECSQRRHLFDSDCTVGDFEHVIVSKTNVVETVAEYDLVDLEHFADAGGAAAGQRAVGEGQQLVSQRGSDRQGRCGRESIIAAASELSRFSGDKAGVVGVRCD